MTYQPTPQAKRIQQIVETYERKAQELDALEREVAARIKALEEEIGTKKGRIIQERESLEQVKLHLVAELRKFGVSVELDEVVTNVQPDDFHAGELYTARAVRKMEAKSP